MDIALLLIRVIVASVFAAHACQKLFGWFSGPGVEKAALGFAALGQRPAKAMVLLAAATELVAAVSLFTGLLTPLGAAMGFSAMLVAGFALTIKSRTFWNVTGGGEYPFILAAVTAALAFSGGRYSLDSLIGAPWAADGPWNSAVIGCLAITLGIIAAIVPIVRTRPPSG